MMAREVDAQVAELVDALASGASGRKVVEVRVFSWAPSSIDSISEPNNTQNIWSKKTMFSRKS